jgi:hypothetical protein
MPRRKKIGAPTPPRPRQTILALELPEHPVDLQAHVAPMLDTLDNDKTHFLALAPQIAQAKTDNANLLTAIGVASTGGPVEHRKMLDAAETVRQDMRELKPLVQGILRKLPPDQVPAILAAILMHQSKIGTRHPQPPLKFDQGPSGSALLRAAKILLALVYDWEMNLDGTTFTLFGKTHKPHVTITGLTPGKQYWFRVSAFTRDDITTPYVTIGPFMMT